MRSEHKPEKLQPCLWFRNLVIGLVGTVALSLVTNLVYLLLCCPISCLWGHTIALVPEISVWVCPVVLPIQPWRVVHNLKIHLGCFLSFILTSSSSSSLVLLSYGLSWISVSSDFLIVPWCQELLWQVELRVDHSLQSPACLFGKRGPQTSSCSTVTLVCVKCGSSLYLPKIQQSVTKKYENSHCYQPLLKSKCWSYHVEVIHAWSSFLQGRSNVQTWPLPEAKVHKIFPLFLHEVQETSLGCCLR